MEHVAFIFMIVLFLVSVLAVIDRNVPILLFVISCMLFFGFQYIYNILFDIYLALI